MKLFTEQKYRTLLLSVLALGTVSMTYGQEDPIQKTPYYVSINNRPANEIIELQDYVFSFEYNDRFGQWKNIPLKIFNWKREMVATLSLAKILGPNYYNVKLDELYGGWVQNEIYVCELSDEAGNRHKISLRPVKPSKKVAPNVGIVVNPLQLQCDGISATSVEFVGDINGGKTPYTIQWVVLNNERTALLYQPAEEIIKTDGSTSAITVNKSPDYFVVLEVKDACDNIVRKEVHMVCDQQKKKISTVFVEPLKAFPGITIK
jgi:hypothetical protein